MNSDFDAWFDRWAEAYALEENFNRRSMAMIIKKDLLTRQFKAAMKVSWLAAKESK